MGTAQRVREIRIQNLFFVLGQSVRRSFQKGVAVSNYQLLPICNYIYFHRSMKTSFRVILTSAVGAEKLGQMLVRPGGRRSHPRDAQELLRHRKGEYEEDRFAGVEGAAQLALGDGPRRPH